MKKIFIIRVILGVLLMGFNLESINAEFYSMLAPTNYTSPSYTQPKYDVFRRNFDTQPIPYEDDDTDTSPIATFTISTDQSGLPINSGTTNTKFIFNATPSTDKESNFLQTRWDFENDSKVDSYFSTVKTIYHTYEKPGIYNVKLEVLDFAGNISTTYRNVTVVNDTAPNAYFTFDPIEGTGNDVIHFDTSGSSDDQYLKPYLKYRFDFESDGKWNTKFETKTSWFHKFEKPGNYLVTMEVKDPAGEKASYSQEIRINENSLPIADFTFSPTSNNFGVGYIFNASASSDKETDDNRLLYRWDFNYHGENDIVFDTAYSFSYQYSWYYKTPGIKTVRLEVTDSDGETAYAYKEISVSFMGAIMNNIFHN